VQEQNIGLKKWFYKNK